MIIVDEILDQMDATKSGVVAGSVTQTIQSGVETVPTSIIQQKVGGSAGNTYTTLPLYPIVSNCCMDKSFIHKRFTVRFRVDVTLPAAIDADHDGTAYVPMWFGPSDTSALPNQVQVLLEGSTIYNTNYQREESVLSNNSLPEIILRGSNRYSTIDKLKQGVKDQPMQRLLIAVPITHNTTTGHTDVEVVFDLAIDMNTLNPLLSNMHFTTKHFGKLQLKLFFAEIEKAFCFCPDYNFSMLNKADTTSAASLNTSLLKGQIRDSFYAFYPFAEYVTEGAIAKTKIPFYCLTRDDTTGDTTFKSVLLENITFSNPDSGNFYAVDKVDMCQTNFDIRYEEYQRLESHFTSMGSIIIPTQTWRTTPFQSSPTNTPGNGWTGNYVGIGSGNNIDFVGVWCHSLKSPCCFYTLPLQGVQFQINGQNINPIPYPYIDTRAVTDFTQAIIDTDHEEISKDYVNCLTFLNIDNTDSYVNKANLTVPAYYNRGGVLTSPGLSNANKFAMYFSTNLPDSFHTGKCVLEDTVNTPNVRLIGEYSSAFYTKNSAARDLYPIWYDNYNGKLGSLLGFSLFCDYCIVLKYDASRGVCFDGVLSPAAPYL